MKEVKKAHNAGQMGKGSELRASDLLDTKQGVQQVRRRERAETRLGGRRCAWNRCCEESL